MNTEQITKLEKSIQNMVDKLSRIYFLVQDTRGNAKASVSYIYDMALTFKRNGYNSIILHEKNDYMGVSDWLGEEYMDELPHKSIDGQNLEVSPEDLIIIPEIYGFIMDQITKLPCGKIVISQSYDYIFETLQPGQTWSQLGFLKCITTSEKQKDYIESVMRNVSVDVIEPVISEKFNKSEYPAKTIIAIHTREHRDTINLVKTFYTKYPQYRWITFRDLRGLTVSEFSNGIKEAFVSVWIDQNSSFGTFPLESMKCGVPVIGLVPNMVPEWMNEDNGIWINNQNMVIDVISDFIQNWLEDNINPELYTTMESSVSKVTNKSDFDNNVVSIFGKMISTRIESFSEQLNKLETIE